MRTNIIDLSAQTREQTGLNLIINRDADKQYEFCKGTRVIWAVKTMGEAKRFIEACKLNRSWIDRL